MPWKRVLPLKWVPQKPRTWDREITDPIPTEADHDKGRAFVRDSRIIRNFGSLVGEAAFCGADEAGCFVPGARKDIATQICLRPWCGLWAFACESAIGYFLGSFMSCTAMICHLPLRFIQVSVQMRVRLKSLPSAPWWMAVSLP